MSDQIPASIAAAWGLRERPTKGPKRALSLDAIVAAGVAVASGDGLGAVSMARVATEVGAKTMSLYRYVESKDELLRLMVDAAYGRPPDGDPRHLGWREGLMNFGRAERTALGRHPWVVQVSLGAGPPAAPNQIAWLEWGLTTMRGTGLTPHEKMEVMLMVTMFVRSEVTLAAQMAAAQREVGATNEQVMSGYRAMLKQLLDPAKFPEMLEVLDSGMFDEPDDPDYEFTFGMGRILDGVEVLIDSRTLS